MATFETPDDIVRKRQALSQLLKTSSFLAGRGSVATGNSVYAPTIRVGDSLIGAVKSTIPLVCLDKTRSFYTCVRYVNLPDDSGMYYEQLFNNSNGKIVVEQAKTQGDTRVAGAIIQRCYLAVDRNASFGTTETWYDISKAVPSSANITPKVRILFTVSLDTSIYGKYSFNVNFRLSSKVVSQIIAQVTFDVVSVVAELDSFRLLVDGKTTNNLKSGERCSLSAVLKQGGLDISSSESEEYVRVSVRYGSSNLAIDKDSTFTAPTVTKATPLSVCLFVDTYDIKPINKTINPYNQTFNLDPRITWWAIEHNGSLPDQYKTSQSSVLASLFASIEGQESYTVSPTSVAYETTVYVVPETDCKEIHIRGFSGIGYAYPERLVLTDADPKSNVVTVRLAGDGPIEITDDAGDTITTTPNTYEISLKPPESSTLATYFITTSSTFTQGNVIDVKTGERCLSMDSFYTALWHILEVKGVKNFNYSGNFQYRITGLKPGDVGTVKEKPIETSIINSKEDSSVPVIDVDTDYSGSLYFRNISLNGGTVPKNSVLVGGKLADGSYAKITNIRAEGVTVDSTFCSNCDFIDSRFTGRVVLDSTAPSSLKVLPSIVGCRILDCVSYNGGKISPDNESCSAMFKDCDIRMSRFSGAESDLFEDCTLVQCVVTSSTMLYFNKGGTSTGCVFDLVHGPYVYINKPVTVRLTGEVKKYYSAYTYIGIDEPLDLGGMNDCSVTRCKIEYDPPDEDTLNKNDWLIVKTMDFKGVDIGETAKERTDEQKRDEEIDDLLTQPVRSQLACAADIDSLTASYMPAADLYPVYIEQKRRLAGILSTFNGLKTARDVMNKYGETSQLYALWLFLQTRFGYGPMHMPQQDEQAFELLCFIKSSNADIHQIQAQLVSEAERRAREAEENRARLKAEKERLARERRELHEKYKKEVEEKAKQKREVAPLLSAGFKPIELLCCFNGNTGHVHKYEMHPSTGKSPTCPSGTTASSGGKRTVSYTAVYDTCDSNFAEAAAAYREKKAKEYAEYMKNSVTVIDAYGNKVFIGSGACNHVSLKRASGIIETVEACANNGRVTYKHWDSKKGKFVTTSMGIVMEIAQPAASGNTSTYVNSKSMQVKFG